MDLNTLKNDYAQEQGYEDWVDLAIHHELKSDRLDQHWTEICIRAQKAALENAAKNTSTQYVRPKTFHYKEIENFITNEQNLIL